MHQSMKNSFNHMHVNKAYSNKSIVQCILISCLQISNVDRDERLKEKLTKEILVLLRVSERHIYLHCSE